MAGRLGHDMGMINISQFAFRLGLGLALVVTGAASPGRVSTVSAQAPNACALVTVDEVGQIANASVAEGVSSALEPAGSVTCRYTWGTGVNRFKLDVTVNEASRMFPGTSPDQIKQHSWSQSEPGLMMRSSRRSARPPCSFPSRPFTPARPHW